MWVFIFLIGLCFGSFVNMVIYRTAINYKLESRKFKVKSESRSYCDFCGKRLRIIDNIPVLSWLVLKGKSSCCGKKLSVLYPIVELVMGLLFVFYYFKFGLDILGLLVIVFLVLGAVFDLKYMILPDWSTVVLVGLAVVRLIMGGGTPPVHHFLSAMGASGFLGILYILTKGKGMGLGDVKLAVFMGLWLGWPNIIVAFYVAFIVGALYGLLLIVSKKASRKTAVPFGPFLILGTILSWCFGSDMISLINETGFYFN